MNNTTSKHEAFLCNVSDGVMASLMGKRLHMMLNDKKLDKATAAMGFGVSTCGTFDNNYMYLTNDNFPIDDLHLAVAKRLVAMYFNDLQPYIPEAKITFKELVNF